MKVVDSNGVIIEGLERTKSNGLIVTDKAAYNKYLAEKDRALKIKNLEAEVLEIKSALTEILGLLRNK